MGRRNTKEEARKEACLHRKKLGKGWRIKVFPMDEGEWSWNINRGRLQLYHTEICYPNVWTVWANGLSSGHGSTPKIAIRKALRAGRKVMYDSMKAVADVETIFKDLD